jgi:hypothetical protein
MEFNIRFIFLIPKIYDSSAMAQVVSRRPLTAEARVIPCRICDGQSDTRSGFSPSFSGFPCQYHSTAALHTHISSAGWTTGPLVAAVQRHSLIPLTRTTTTTRQMIFRFVLINENILTLYSETSPGAYCSEIGVMALRMLLWSKLLFSACSVAQSV